MLLLLAAAQLAGALMVAQPQASRTAVVPPLSVEDVAMQRHSLHWHRASQPETAAKLGL